MRAILDITLITERTVQEYTLMQNAIITRAGGHLPTHVHIKACLAVAPYVIGLSTGPDYGHTEELQHHFSP